MITAQEYWWDRLGRYLSPTAGDWMDALMSSYPHAQPGKPRTRIGGSEPGRFLISDDTAQVWAPVLPETDLPSHISFQPTAARKRRDWVVDVIMDPPKPPFLAASVGMSAADAAFWQISISAELIAFGGAASLFEGQSIVIVDRQAFLEAATWFRETGAPVSDLLRLSETRERFKTGILTGAQARAPVARLKTPVAEMDRYPGSRDPVLMKLAAYAATEWAREGVV